MSIALIGICLVVGLLIGAVGIGGVLLVPSLSLIAGVSVHEAIPACMLSYLATGAVGAAVFARRGSIQWKMVLWVCIGAVPAAYLGASSLLAIPATVIKLLIAGMMILAGVDALRTSSRKTQIEEGQGRGDLRRTSLIAIGFITGFGSAITGTGGPLILVPLTLYLGLPVLTAVGLSQAIQIPIATFASIGNWMQGNLNIELGIAIALSMVIGSFAGATVVHHVPSDVIKKTVAVLLIVVGVIIAAKVIILPPTLN